MKRISIAFLLTAAVGSALFACMPLTPMALVILNKKGVVLKAVPSARLEKAAKEFGAESIEAAGKRVTFRFPLKQVVDKIGTAVDLRPWFKEKSCVKSWDRFHQCLKEGKNPADEKLYIKLDREFVAKVICQDEECCDDEEGKSGKERGNTSQKMRNGSKDALEWCKNPDAPGWTLRWDAPYFITLDAEIGSPGGFRTVDEAKEALHRINTLLNKVLPGARFPEDFGEGRSEFEVYYENHRMLPPPKKIGKKMVELLRMLQKEGYLLGLTKADLKTIGRLAAVYKEVFYVPRGCESAITISPPSPRRVQEIAKPGWHALSMSARLDFDSNRCPHIEFVK